MSNLAEGFERGSSSEFHQFIVIAKASTQHQFDDATKLAEEVSRVIGGLKTAVKKRNSS